jgi:hypothetical protein
MTFSIITVNTSSIVSTEDSSITEFSKLLSLQEVRFLGRRMCPSQDLCHRKIKETNLNKNLVAEWEMNPQPNIISAT